MQSAAAAVTSEKVFWVLKYFSKQLQESWRQKNKQCGAGKTPFALLSGPTQYASWFTPRCPLQSHALMSGLWVGRWGLYSWLAISRQGLVRRTGSLGAWPGRIYLPFRLCSSVFWLPNMSRTALLTGVLSSMPFSTSELTKYKTETLRTWAKINLSPFKLLLLGILSQQGGKWPRHML